MDPISKLDELASRHPLLQFSRSADGIAISAADGAGFAVHVYRDSNHWMVSLRNGAWHEEFSEPENVLNFVAWCFSGQARLREIKRGNVVQKAVLEANEGDGWYVESTVGYFLFPYWRSQRTTVYENSNLLSQAAE